MELRQSLTFLSFYNHPQSLFISIKNNTTVLVSYNKGPFTNIISQKNSSDNTWMGPFFLLLSSIIPLVPKGMNLNAPPNHPDPIYAGFRTRPFERNPTTRVPAQQHRGGE